MASQAPSGWRRVLITFLCLAFALPAVAQSCSAANQCTTGCCSKFGFCGLGPEYCDKSVCVANCDRKAYCDPGNYTTQFAEVSKCPLNVCCSKWGYCGLTEEFCGTKKVKRPSCNKSGPINRVVGYYEGWSLDRSCNAFAPEQIPVGVYTHLNYAFASIDPVTFEVRPTSRKDKNLYRRLVALKQRDPDLKVFIAIGGWTFNDPGPTATTFSDIARSETNQRVFFKSLLSFMATYGFDGVDLDWEYPEAPDRSGRGVDYANFPKMMANLKNALKSSGGRDGLSITIPASYWYLQHFDIVKLAKSVDFFNIMSYDLHGTWDQGNKWTGPYLNAHTNLTEIKDALDLLWRNQINPDMVTLGTAFYGRGFTARNSGCLRPGCVYSSGAKRQKCSNEISVLLNSEIVDIMSSKGRKPTLDKEAAVKILTFDDDQWVAYDDEDTLQMKADFARSQCLGGLMVWAVSHDTSDGRFSRALGTASGRKYVSALASRVEDPVIIINKVPQCFWTNCGETCPSGYLAVPRTDGKYFGTGTLMLDSTACGNSRAGVRTFCCPMTGEPLPRCGWYSHNNGKCDGECPSGTYEVGSINIACRSGFQTACCTAGPSTGMDLYPKCKWQAWPDCSAGVCDLGIQTTILSHSMTGSGGSVCAKRKADDHRWGNDGDRQVRINCCITDDGSMRFEDCQWYTNVGLPPGDKNFCTTSCPAGTVRLALEQNSMRCSSNRGAAVQCCTPKAQTYETQMPVISAEDQSFNIAMDLFMDDPERFCSSAPMSFSKEDMSNMDTDVANVSLVSRGDPLLDFLVLPEVTKLGLKILAPNPPQSEIDIWDEHMAGKYPFLAREELFPYLINRTSFADYGDYMAEMVLCNMDYYNSDIEAAGAAASLALCACSRPDACDDDDDLYCISGTEDDSISSRDLSSRTQTTEGKTSRSLEKRGAPRPFEAKFDSPVDGREHRLNFNSHEYPSAGEENDNNWPIDHPIYNRIYAVPNPQDCPSTFPAIESGWQNFFVTQNRRVITEHIFELATVAVIIRAMGKGEFRGRTLLSGPLDPYFLETTLAGNLPATPAPPTLTGGYTGLNIIKRIMWTMGTTDNPEPFVVAESSFNTKKMTLWRNNNPVSDDRMTTLIGGMRDLQTSSDVLCKMRLAMSVIRYLNDPEVFEKLVTVVRDMRAEFERASALYPAATRYKVLSAFDQIVDWQFRDMVFKIQDFISRHSEAIRTQLGSTNTASWAVKVRKFVTSLEYQASNLNIGRTGMGITTHANIWSEPVPGSNFADEDE